MKLKGLIGSRAVLTVVFSLLVLVAGCAGRTDGGSQDTGSSVPVSSTVPVVAPSTSTTIASVVSTSTFPVAVSSASEVTVPEFPEPVSSVSAGIGGMVCNLYEDGAVACQENNTDRAIGGLEEFYETELQYVEGISDAVNVVAGASHICALHADSTVSCWGLGVTLGSGTESDSEAPVKVTGISDVRLISTYYYHTCAVLSGGAVYCWGDNSKGQLGNGTYDTSLTPVRVVGIDDATFVSASAYSTCVAHADHTISCWGKNEYGQLGDRTAEDSAVPVKVLGVDDAKAVFPGFDHTCYIHLDGGVSCWGNGNYGIFRDGNSYLESENPCMDYECEISGYEGYTQPFDYASLSPRRIPGLSNVVSILTGVTACATLSDGSEQCWGCHPNYGGCREGHYPDEQEG